MFLKIIVFRNKRSDRLTVDGFWNMQTTVYTHLKFWWWTHQQNFIVVAFEFSCSVTRRQTGCFRLPDLVQTFIQLSIFGLRLYTYFIAPARCVPALSCSHINTQIDLQTDYWLINLVKNLLEIFTFGVEAIYWISSVESSIFHFGVIVLRNTLVDRRT